MSLENVRLWMGRMDSNGDYDTATPEDLERVLEAWRADLEAAKQADGADTLHLDTVVKMLEEVQQNIRLEGKKMGKGRWECTGLGYDGKTIDVVINPMTEAKAWEGWIGGYTGLDLVNSLHSRLIKLASNVCESYASDILIDINTIDRKADRAAAEMQDYAGRRVLTLVGFRAHGTDHPSFIASRLEPGIYTEESTAITELYPGGIWAVVMDVEQSSIPGDLWGEVSLHRVEAIAITDTTK